MSTVAFLIRLVVDFTLRFLLQYAGTGWARRVASARTLRQLRSLLRGIYLFLTVQGYTSALRLTYIVVYPLRWFCWLGFMPYPFFWFLLFTGMLFFQSYASLADRAFYFIQSVLDQFFFKAPTFLGRLLWVGCSWLERRGHWIGLWFVGSLWLRFFLFVLGYFGYALPVFTQFWSTYLVPWGLLLVFLRTLTSQLFSPFSHRLDSFDNLKRFVALISHRMVPWFPVKFYKGYGQSDSLWYWSFGSADGLFYDYDRTRQRAFEQALLSDPWLSWPPFSLFVVRRFSELSFSALLVFRCQIALYRFVSLYYNDCIRDPYIVPTPWKLPTVWFISFVTMAFLLTLWFWD